MRLFFCLCFCLLFSPSSYAVYLLRSEQSVPLAAKQRAYQEVLLQEDYPLCLNRGKIFPAVEELNLKLAAIHPQLQAEWVPTSLFQLFVLHSYFRDLDFQEYVQRLGFTCRLFHASHPAQKEKFDKFRTQHGVSWELNVDEEVIEILGNPEKHSSDLEALYQRLNQREEMGTFFVKLCDHFFAQMPSNTQERLDYLLAAVPLEIEVWENHHFPALFGDESKDSVVSLLHFLKNHSQAIREAIKQETLAFQEREVLLYRGSDVVLFEAKSGKRLPLLLLPVKAQKKTKALTFNKDMSSFSLSYGNSLFGGLFFSIDACAARYGYAQEGEYVFHALRVGEVQLIQDPLFCIPPLHPFVEMLVDGEWFHPHTKIAQHREDARCYGWYAEGNQTFEDRQGFLIRKDCTPHELGAKILKHAAHKAIVLHRNHKDVALDLKDHKKAMREL